MNKNVILHLSLIEGVGPATITTIMRQCGGVLDDIYQWTVEDFGRLRIPALTAVSLSKGLKDSALIGRELEALERLKKYGHHAVSWTTVFDEDYPVWLKNIYLPPAVLYWQGRHPATYEKCIAFVGSRKANSYCSQVVQRLIPPLVKDGWCIVSGGALGADALAHHAALQAGGSTIAVIGSGLLKPYPASNSSLFSRIIDNGGTLISPFRLSAPAQPGNFPARNRIIAGLCRGCVVLQAALKSGALITASYALDQGREVYAVPGAITDELSAGCNQLIAQGAHIVSDVQDILSPLGHSLPGEFQGVLSESVDSAVTNVLLKQQTIAFDNHPEQELLGVFGNDSLSFEELLEKTALHASLLLEKLFALQLEGKIEQNFVGLWQVKTA